MYNFIKTFYISNIIYDINMSKKDKVFSKLGNNVVFVYNKF